MKATIDLPENLLAEARIAARNRGWTVRALFEESLRSFLDAEPPGRGAPFRLRHRIVKGKEAPTMSFAEMLEASGVDRRKA